MVRTLLGTALLMGCMTTHGAAQPGSVFLEVPLLLESPGRQQVVRAWNDGERFYVDAAMLLELLGFTTAKEGATLTALDAKRRMVLDFAQMRALTPEAISLRELAFYGNGQYLLSTEGLKLLFAADLHFDPERLELRISTAAERFDASVLHSRRAMWNEAPGPLWFGRERKFLGGVMASWRLHRDTYYTSVHLQFTGSLLGGAVQGLIGGAKPVGTYLFDRPHARELTRIEFGRFTDGLRGIYLSNRPLARRQLHRIHVIAGRVEPHALVEAVISGHLVDQVQANAEGYYELRTPAWYGTTIVELHVRSLGGTASTAQRRYLLTDHTLVEPGRLYYDLRAGRAGKRNVVQAELQYGMLPRLTVRSKVDPWHQQYQTGLTVSVLRFVTVSYDVTWPSRNWLTRLRIWRRSLSLDGAWDWRAPDSNGKHAQLSGVLGPLSVTASGSSYSESGRWKSSFLSSSLWYHTKDGLFVRARWHGEQAEAKDIPLHKVGEWRLAVGQSLVRARVAVYASGQRRWHGGGVECFVALSNWSLGFTAAWDKAAGGFVGGFTIQINTPLALLTARARQSGNGFTHAQSLQGSIHMGRSIAFMRAAHQKSAVLLRIFEDANGDGRKDKDERLLPYVKAQLYHAAWERLPDGVLRAAYLEPYAAYQVQILESSIRDPHLTPATGYTFSFIADPGRTKVIDVPMQRVPAIRGTIVNADRAPSRLRVRISGVQDIPVFRDGGFTVQLKPGIYTLSVEDVLTGEVLLTQSVQVRASSPPIVLDMARS